MESHGAVESIVHVVAFERSNKSLERHSPEVTGWILYLSEAGQRGARQNTEE